MVQGRTDQAHRPGHVREDLIPNNDRTGPAKPGLDWPVPTGCFNGAHPRIATARAWPVRGERVAFQRPVGYLESFPHGFHNGGKQRKGTHRMATTANRRNTALKEAMTKTQILAALSESTGLQKKDVASVLDQLGVVIERHIRRRAVGMFTLPGLLKIKVVRKPATKARKMMSPFTGQEITVAAKPASRAVKVQPLSGLKRMTE